MVSPFAGVMSMPQNANLVSLKQPKKSKVAAHTTKVASYDTIIAYTIIL